LESLKKRSKGLTIIREPTGEVRLAWKLILILLLFVGMEVLLRVIPMDFIAAFMVNAGMTRASVVESASTLIFEDPLGSTVIGVLIGLMGFLIVWFLVRVVEKSTFTWKAFGLDWRRNSPSMILLGALLALILFIASMIIARLFGTSNASVDRLLLGTSIVSFFQKCILFIAMGFGEEVVFRAYMQTRLIERFGVIWGILGTALVYIASPDILSYVARYHSFRHHALNNHRCTLLSEQVALPCFHVPWGHEHDVEHSELRGE
jgi:membrane protease YdiL (CAAX protease family)